MNKNKTVIYDDEKTISLLDMCFYVLGKWKLMVVVAAALAIVTAGFSYVKSGRDAKAAIKVLSLEEVEAAFATEDALKAAQIKINQIEEHKQNVEERDYYLENSIKVKLDPNKFYEGKAIYVVCGNDENDILKAVTLLKTQILSEDTFEAMAARLPGITDVALLKEVVKVETEYHVSGAEVIVTVNHYAQEECANMLETLPKTSAGVELIAAQVNLKSDYTLMNLSSDMLNNRNRAYDTMKSLKNGMSDLEKTYYDLLNNSETEIETDSAQTPKVSMDLKLVIIAAFVGAFAVAGLYCVFYLFSGYVHTKEELESWISAPVLSMDSDLEMNATMLVGIIGEKNVDKIYLTSSLETSNETWMKDFSESLKLKKIETIIGAGICDNPSALQKAVETGAMVLVEKSYKSKEKDIRETIMKANSCGVRVCSIILEK